MPGLIDLSPHTIHSLGCVLTCQRIIQQSQDLLMFADVDKPWLTQILHLGDY